MLKLKSFSDDFKLFFLDSLGIHVKYKMATER